MSAMAAYIANSRSAESNGEPAFFWAHAHNNLPSIINFLLCLDVVNTFGGSSQAEVTFSRKSIGSNACAKSSLCHCINMTISS